MFNTPNQGNFYYYLTPQSLTLLFNYSCIVNTEEKSYSLHSLSADSLNYNNKRIWKFLEHMFIFLGICKR